MAVVFQSNTGKVVALPDKVAQGSFSLVEADPNITYSGEKSIITRVGISCAGNYQFLHTIGNDVYIYVFGDRMGEVTLHGISFQGDCQGGGGGGIAGVNPTTTLGNPATGKHGFELLYDWYKKNRIAARQTPIDVTIGTGTTFRGFVTSLTGDVQDTLRRTIQFTITIALLPDKEGSPQGNLAMNTTGGNPFGGIV